MRAVLVALSIGALGLLAIGPAANAQEAGSDGVLFIDADTVLGPTNLTEEERPTKVCVQASRFAQNEEVVWRVKVFDPLTGQPMDDTMLASLEVKLPTETLVLHYGGHPRDTPVDFFWTVGWDVPEGYPTGAVEYTIDATALDGRTGTWEQFGVSLAQLTITDEVRPIIEEEAA
jgi:hypothetical protein